MLVDFDNPTSMEYSEIARKSWQPAIDLGLISEIVLQQCVTPKTLNDHKPLYHWRKSLALIDASSNQKEMSPSEMAGMCSHWMLMRRQINEDRFLIMEHDSYLLDVDDFSTALGAMIRHDVPYANLGLYMSCYSYNKHAAEWMTNELIVNQLWVNCGPYAMAEKLYKNYAQHFLSKRNYNNEPYAFLQTFKNHEVIGTGKTADDMFRIYNFEVGDRRGFESTDGMTTFRTPSTQCFKEGLGVTQHHHNYHNATIHTLNPFFKKID